MLLAVDGTLLRQEDRYGVTPIGLAALLAKYRVMRVLIELGEADPGSPHVSQPAPTAAPSEPSNQVVGAAAAGARSSLSPLVMAARQADEEMARSLLSSIDPAELASDEGHAMLKAAMRAAVVGDSVGVLRLLLEAAGMKQQCDVDERDECGDTLLLQVSWARRGVE